MLRTHMTTIGTRMLQIRRISTDFIVSGTSEKKSVKIRSIRVICVPIIISLT
jgi:hypothetical protein